MSGVLVLISQDDWCIVALRIITIEMGLGDNGTVDVLFRCNRIMCSINTGLLCVLQISPILKSLQWDKINEQIEYKSLSVVYATPKYYYYMGNLIFVIV